MFIESDQKAFKEYDRPVHTHAQNERNIFYHNMIFVLGVL